MKYALEILSTFQLQSAARIFYILKSEDVI